MQLQLQYYLNLFRPAPPQWFEGISESNGSSLESLPCESYDELVSHWKDAMEWTDFLDITLTCMLATVTSTPLQGDQVWLRTIGIPGTAKTTICEALLVNKTFCKPLSIVTGLHSGYRDASGKDFSLIDRLNRKTAIWNEGDTLANASNRDQTLSQLRDIYSGFTHNDFRNQEAKSYEGLRITVILAGTNKLRMLNSSALGDRFLDCVIYKRESEVAESKLVRNVLRNNRLRRISESNGRAENQDSPEKVLAKQKTAGYIDYLRSQGVSELRKLVNSTPETILDRADTDCEMLGRLVAYMRTRSGAGGDEEPTEKELHIRLAEQLSKMAQCTAVVMSRPLDSEVMRRVAKVAYDTCYGNTWDVTKSLITGPLELPALANQVRRSQDVVQKSLGILHQLEAIRIEGITSPSGAKGRGRSYRLSHNTTTLTTRLQTLLGKTNV